MQNRWRQNLKGKVKKIAAYIISRSNDKETFVVYVYYSSFLLHKLWGYRAKAIATAWNILNCFPF